MNVEVMFKEKIEGKVQGSQSLKNTQFLPYIIRRNGFTYTLELRGKRSSVYCQHVTHEIKYYEVFLRKIMPEKVIKGVVIPAHEKFPRNEDFGVWAWTIQTRQRAIDKFNQLEYEK